MVILVDLSDIGIVKLNINTNFSCVNLCRDKNRIPGTKDKTKILKLMVFYIRNEKPFVKNTVFKILLPRT
jgi:hypothetical protein